MYNAHEDQPVVFQTRWTMSYLCGPLTRTQIKTLMDPRRPEFAAAGGPRAAPAGTLAATPDVTAETPQDPATAPAADAAVGKQPSLPPEIPQFYLPVRGATPAGGTLIYQPGVLAAATVNFVNSDTGAATSSKVRRIAQAPESALAVNWDAGTVVESPLEDMDRQPYPGATFTPLPAAMAKLTSYRSWASDFSAWTYRTQATQVFRSPGFKLTSNPDETEREFRARLQLATREKRDELTEKIRTKYAAKTATLQQQLLRAGHAVRREEEQAKNRKMQTAISFGATLLGAGRSPGARS